MYRNMEKLTNYNHYINMQKYGRLSEKYIAISENKNAL